MAASNFADVGGIDRYFLPPEAARRARSLDIEPSITFMRINEWDQPDEYVALLNSVRVAGVRVSGGSMPLVIGPFDSFAQAQAEADLTLICKAFGL